jgi:hypothetical protein
MNHEGAVDGKIKTEGKLEMKGRPGGRRDFWPGNLDILGTFLSTSFCLIRRECFFTTVSLSLGNRTHDLGESSPEK